MNFWLVKTEPNEYSFEKLIKEKKAVWDGIRNYQARNFLKEMKKRDLVLVYHSGEKKEIVGIAKVITEHYNDPKDETNTWFVVELEAITHLDRTFPLVEIKSENKLSGLLLHKQSRLSIMPIQKDEFDFILKKTNTKLLVY